MVRRKPQNARDKHGKQLEKSDEKSGLKICMTSWKGWSACNLTRKRIILYQKDRLRMLHMRYQLLIK